MYLVTEMNSIIQSLIKTRGNCFDSQTSDDKIRIDFLLTQVLYTMRVWELQKSFPHLRWKRLSPVPCAVCLSSRVQKHLQGVNQRLWEFRGRKMLSGFGRRRWGILVGFMAEGAVRCGGGSHLRRRGYECIGLLDQQWSGAENKY